jgi:hypothetical protein
MGTRDSTATINYYYKSTASPATLPHPSRPTVSEAGTACHRTRKKQQNKRSQRQPYRRSKFRTSAGVQSDDVILLQVSHNSLRTSRTYLHSAEQSEISNEHDQCDDPRNHRHEARQ